MKLLKVGDHYINLDLVTDIQKTGDAITLYLAVAANAGTTARGDIPFYIGQGVRVVKFEGEDAKNLQKWLESPDNSVDVKPKTKGRGVNHGSTGQQD